MPEDTMRTSLPLSRFGLAILLLVIWVGPFFQGYFFPTPALAAMATTAGAFLLWAVGRRRQHLALDLPGDWTGALLLALTGWCLLSTLWAIYVRDNLTLVLQVVTGFAAFAVVRAENTTEVRRAIVWVLSLSALVVAVLGLLEYSGFFLEHVALGNVLQVEPRRNRVYTLFQYPNTAAIFFLSALLLQNARLLSSESWTEKIVLAGTSAVLAVACTLTLSRGAVLIAPVSVVLLCIGLSPHQILPSLLHWVTAAALPVALTLWPITRAAAVDAWPTVLLWAAVAALVAALGTGSLRALLQLPRRVQVIAACTLLAALTVVGTVAAPRVFNQLPSVFTRISHLDLRDITQDGRVEFLRDAARLAVRRPWGYGGGGWLRTYTQVQRYNYVARDPHSHYALTLVESGFLGLALLLGALVLAARGAFQARRGDPVRWSMGVAALTLALHAAVDIDLSYYALWLLLWTLIGASQAEGKPLPGKQERRLTFALAFTLATATILVSSTMFLAARSYNDASTAVLVGDNAAALTAGRRAIRLDPLNSQYRTMIPTSENINRALQLDPYNEELWRFVSEMLEAQGDVSGALTAAWQALELRPMSIEHYERVAELLVGIMTEAVLEGRITESVEIAQKIIALGETMERRGEPSLEKQPVLFPDYLALTWTPRMSLAAGQAYLVTGQFEAADRWLTAALANSQTAPDAALWLHALYTRTGNHEKLASLEPAPSEQARSSPLYAALIGVQ